MDLSSLLILIQSSKAKERIEALNDLEFTLDSAVYINNLTVKTTINVIESLYNSINFETKLLLTKQTNLVELRVLRCFKLIKSLVSLKIKSFKKSSQYLSIIDHLFASLKTLIQFPTIVLEPLKLLSLLTLNIALFFSMNDNDYSKLCNNLLQLFDDLLSKLYPDSKVSESINNNSHLLITELLQAMDNCITSISNLPSPKLVLFKKNIFKNFTYSLITYLNIVDCSDPKLSNIDNTIPPLQYSKKSTISHLSLSLIFEISTALITYNSLQFSEVLLKLIEKLFRIIPSINLFNYTLLKRNLLIFLVVSSDFLYLKFNAMITGPSLSLKEFIITIKGILSFVHDNYLNLLDFTEIGFYHNNVHHRHIFHWFKLDYIYLKNYSNSELLWLSGLCFVKLINLYYDLSEKCTEEIRMITIHKTQDPDNSVPYGNNQIQYVQRLKKRKLNGTVINIALLNDNFFDFIVDSLNSKNYVIGCIYLCYHLSINHRYNVKTSQLLTQVIRILNNHNQESVEPYLLLASKVILDYLTFLSKASHKINQDEVELEIRTILKSDILLKLLKIAIRSIKYQNLCDVSSSLASTILNLIHPHGSSNYSHILADLSLVRLIQSTIDEINLNGPYHLNNFSLIFWMNVISLVLPNNLDKNKSLIVKITNWIHAKLNIDRLDLDSFKKSMLQDHQYSLNNSIEFFKESKANKRHDSNKAFKSLPRNSFSVLGIFIGWLFRNDVIISISSDELYGTDGDLAYNTVHYDRAFMNVSILWLSSKPFRDFMDLSKPKLYSGDEFLVRDNYIKMKQLRSFVSMSQAESFFLEIFKKADKLVKSLNLCNAELRIDVTERLLSIVFIINDIYSTMKNMVPLNQEILRTSESNNISNSTSDELLNIEDDILTKFGQTFQLKIRNINEELLSNLFTLHNVESIMKILNTYNNYLCSRQIDIYKRQTLINCLPDLYKFSTLSLEFLKQLSSANENSNSSDSSTDNSSRSGTPVDSWNIGETFGKVRKLKERKIEENNKKWKHFRLYSNYDLHCSVDKIIFKFISNFRSDTINLDLTEFLQNYSPDQFLNCCDFLPDIVNENLQNNSELCLDGLNILETIQDIDTKKLDPNKLVRLIGEKLLQLPKIEINEIALCSTCKLLTMLIDNISIESDFIDIFKFLLNMNQHNYFNGIETRLAFQELMNKVIKTAFVMKLKVEDNETKIFSNLVSVIDSANPLAELSSILRLNINFLTCKISESYSMFFENAPTSCIVSVYRELYSAFDTPQQDLESFNSFCFFLVGIAQHSDFIKVSATFNILEFSVFSSLKSYVSRSVNAIIDNEYLARSADEVSTKSLSGTAAVSNNSILFFEKYSLYLLNFWQMFEKNSNILDFPFRIFYFESQNQFVKMNYRVMIALIMNIDNKESSEMLLKEIAKIMKMSTKLLISECLPDIISLSFTNHGKRNLIFPILNKMQGDVEYDREISANLQIIILKIIQLTDLVSLKSMQVFIPSFLQFSKIEPPMVFISAKTSKFLIESLIATHANSTGSIESFSTQDFWDVKTLYFIQRHLLLDFESAASSSSQLLSLRKLSVVHSFNIETIGGSLVIINPLIISLTNYISDEALENEVSNFLTTLLLKIKLEDTTSMCIMNLGTKLCNFYISRKLSNRNPLVTWFLNFSSKAPQQSFMSNSKLLENLQNFVLPFFSKILSNSRTLVTALDLERLIKAFSSTSTVSSLYQTWLCNFILLLFEIDNGQNLLAKSEPDILHEKYLVQFLLSIKKIPYQSNKFFNQWIINNLGYFYYCTGYKIQKSNSNKDLLFVERVFQKKKVYYIMSVILRDFRVMLMESDTPNSVKCLMESFIGTIIRYERLDSQTFAQFGDFNLLYAELSEYILDISYLTFRKLYGLVEIFQQSKNNENIKNQVSLFESSFEVSFKDLNFDLWCTKFIEAIVLKLSHKFVFLESFTIFFERAPCYSKRILANLIIFYIYECSQTEGSNDSFIISNIIDRYLKHPNKSVESMEFFVDLSLRLSIAYQYNINDKKLKNGIESNSFSQSFLKKFYFPLSQISCELKLWKTALMFYELSQNSLDNTKLNNESLETCYATLKKIYDSLDVKDIIYSMPSESPSIDTALNLIYRENNSERSTLFNNSLVEANIRYQKAVEDPVIPFAIKSMQKNGLLGLSKFVSDYYLNDVPYGLTESANEYADQSSKSKEIDETYKWAWKLGQWSLPTETEVVSYNTIIYTNLKSFRSKKYPRSNEKQIETILKWYGSCISSKRFNINVEPLKVLGIKWMLSNIMQSSYATNLCRLQIDHKSWLFRKEFNDVEDLLETKQKCLEFQKSETVLFYRIIELHTFGNFARLNKEPQKAINSIMTIRNIIKNEFAKVALDSLKKGATTIAEFSYALNLWDQKETYTPIQMMKNLKRSIENINSQLLNKLVSKQLIDSILVDWLDISKQENSASILNEYIKPYFETTDQSKTSIHETKMNHVFANFCDKQLKILHLRNEINRYQRIIDIKMKDLKESVDINSHEAKRFAYKLKRQIVSDKSYMKLMVETEEKFIKYSIYFYFQSILNSDEYIDTDVDRFFVLWFKYSDKSSVNSMVKQLFFESALGFQFYKILPSISQLFSKLANDILTFQTTLQKILFNVTLNHPYHCLYILKSLILQKEFNKHPDPIMKSRIMAAVNLWNLIKDSNSSFADRYMSCIEQFVNESIKIANFEVTKNMNQIQLSEIQLGTFWNRLLPLLGLALPTKDIPFKKEAFEYDSMVPTIKGISNRIFISSTGVSRPKIVIFELSDGTKDRVLFKGNTDDLRQDSIMEQIFSKVNKMLIKEKEIYDRKLNMRTYNVIPLGPQAGLIEFVANSISFLDAIYSLHSKFDSVSHHAAVKKMSQWESLSMNERVENFKNNLYDTGISPVFHQFFFVNFINPYDWFESRIKYSRGTATCSIVGYILGLGDRHCNNILIDKTTGEPIHIDLGIAFDQGKLLSIPETVPFRLTRDIVDGFGVSGVEGIFRKSCENVFAVLRNNKEHINGILEILKWDPLYMWTISPLRKKRLQENGENDEDPTYNDIDFQKSKASFNSIKETDEGLEATRAVLAVREKLEAKDLSSEGVVRELILTATDYKKLALLFRGWAPFY